MTSSSPWYIDSVPSVMMISGSRKMLAMIALKTPRRQQQADPGIQAAADEQRAAHRGDAHVAADGKVDLPHRKHEDHAQRDDPVVGGLLQQVADRDNPDEIGVEQRDDNHHHDQGDQDAELFDTTD
jgi:hypothetical protein